MSTIIHNNIEREYTLYQPANLKQGCPLVVFLHWHTGCAEDIINFIGFNEIADKYGFAVVYPEGLLDKDKFKHWNANLNISNVDDIGFITSLVTELNSKHAFDSNNTFVTGISNGGFMCYTLALNTPNVFNAYAPVIGSMSYRDWEDRTFKNPVPILHICGLNDELVPPTGTYKDSDGWGGSPSVDIQMAYWAEVNECSTKSVEKLGKNTTAIYYQNGINNNEVWCMKIDNHGHDFPVKTDDIDGGELIWKFFSKYIRK